jgi:hypothetical protein
MIAMRCDGNGLGFFFSLACTIVLGDMHDAVGRLSQSGEKGFGSSSWLGGLVDAVQGQSFFLFLLTHIRFLFVGMHVEYSNASCDCSVLIFWVLG